MARHAAPSHGPRGLLRGAGRLRGPLLTAALGLGALALLGAAACVVLLRVSTQTVLTGSMRGTFDPGALVLARPVPVADVHPGDVLVFTPPGHSTPYVHRVLTVTGDTQPVITTQGDANPSPDAWKARLEGDTVPRVFGSVPHAGRLLLALHGRGLHAALLGLLGTVVAVSGTRLLLGSSGGRRPRLHPAH